VGTSLEKHIKPKGRAGFLSHLAGALQALSKDPSCHGPPGEGELPGGGISIALGLSGSESDLKCCWEAVPTSLPSLSPASSLHQLLKSGFLNGNWRIPRRDVLLATMAQAGFELCRAFLQGGLLFFFSILREKKQPNPAHPNQRSPRLDTAQPWVTTTNRRADTIPSPPDSGIALPGFFTGEKMIQE